MQSEAKLKLLLEPFKDRLICLIPTRPEFISCFLESLEAVFLPKLVLKQLIAIGVIRGFIALMHGIRRIVNKSNSFFTQKGRVARRLKQQMATASTLEEWQRCAETLDEHEGYSEWREELKPGELPGLDMRIKVLKEMIRKEDVFGLMFRLRSGLNRYDFGILDDEYYNVAYGGTKHKIEEYIETVKEALDMICSSRNKKISTEVKLAFFNETRHAFGRTGLMLSGGAAMGFYHGGVLKALLRAKLMPRVISGASAGSIMAAVVGTHTDEEILDILLTGKGSRTNFLTPAFVYSPAAKRFPWRLTSFLSPALQGLLLGVLWTPWNPVNGIKCDSNMLCESIRYNAGGDFTFQEAFDRTGRIINITVAPVSSTDPPRLLNYLTAPHVLVWSAAAASCSVPGVFDPHSLIVKEPDGSLRAESLGTFHTDGSVEADLPMTQLSELFNVNHFVVSQVNPHGVLLSSLNCQVSLSGETDIYGDFSVFGAYSPSALVTPILRFLQAQLRAWLLNVMHVITHRQGSNEWATKRGLGLLLTQSYEGRSHKDITIIPWRGHLSVFSSVAHLLDLPTLEESLQLNRIAEKNTWPHIPRIRVHMSIETKLEECVQRMRKKWAFEAANAHENEYTTPSLVKHSGLSITDRSNLSSGSLNAFDINPSETDEGDGDIPLHAQHSRKGLVKSTSMSRFYYKKSNSANDLNPEQAAGERE